MDYEAKKRFLCQYVEGKGEIAALKNDLEFWRGVGESTSAGSGSIGNHSGGSKVESAAVHIAQIERQIDVDIKTCEETRKNVRNALERFKTGKYKTILCDLYIDGKSRLQIANDRGMTIRAVNAMIHRAIDMIDI